MSKIRLNNLKTNLDKNENLMIEYDKTIEQYIHDGIVEPIPSRHRRQQDVLKRSRSLTTTQDVATTFGKRCLVNDVLKKSDFRRLEDVQFSKS